MKKQNETAKTHSHLMKDISRIKKYAEIQTRMNILRKYQLSQLDKFMKKLLREGRISKKELEKYNIKKRDAARKLFK
jgi:tRNA splicing ligase